MEKLSKKIKKFINLSIPVSTLGNRGMSYVELIVVLSIFSVLTSVVLFNSSNFQEKIDIKNLASDIALEVVGAQKSSTSGTLPPFPQQSIIVPTWRPSYGIYFDIISDNKAFTYFTDLDQDNVFDDPSCASGGECLEKITITKGNNIAALDVFYQNDPVPYSLNDLTVLFKRPDPSPIIRSSQIASPPANSISYVQITIISPRSLNTAVIKIYTSGRVQIGDNPIPYQAPYAYEYEYEYEYEYQTPYGYPTPSTYKTQTFTSNGTWVRPHAGVTSVTVTMAGGGGGGGSNNGHPEGTGAGGGGAQTWTNVSVPVGGNVSVTVGQGGAGGLCAASGFAGTGGNSIFSSLTASGGGGGKNGEGSGGNCAAWGGAAGGAGGQSGQSAISNGGNNECLGGKGGDSTYGTGGATGTYIPDPSIGGAGTGYGAGGGGGGYGCGFNGSPSGGAGGSGFVTVKWLE